MWNKQRRSAGVTLIELVIAIVIVGVALAGMVAAFSRLDRASVDPVIMQQMAIVAEGMMEEILLKNFDDPASTKPAQRIAYTKVADYDGYASTGIVDVEGNAVAGLGTYSIAVEALPPTGAGILQGVPAADSWRIVVTVTHPNAQYPFKLVGWRTRPPVEAIP